MTLAEIGAALKGMFSLRPSKEHQTLLENLDELKTVASASARHNYEFEETMRRIVEAARK